MVARKRLSEIKVLEIPKMTDEQFNAYMIELFFFCDTLPSHIEGILATLEEREYEIFVEFLGTLQGFLENIRANGLANSCGNYCQVLREIMKSGTPLNHDKLVADMEEFFATLDALALDILVAGLIVEVTPERLLPEEEADAPPKEEKPSNILAVDDAEFYLLKLKTQFKGTMHTLHTATYGEDVVRDLAAKRIPVPDMFLIDIEMPDMDGFTLAAAIRKLGITAPILFLTGHASRDTVLAALKASGADLVTKNSSSEQLMDKVRRHL